MRIEGRLTSEKYIEILENHLLPYIAEMFPGVNRVPFLQDRSPIHTSNAVMEWFREHPEIELIPWPSKGADLNPIENIWGAMVQDFDARHEQTSDELFNVVYRLWNSYADNENYYLKLVKSMPRRLRDCIEANGYWTKY